MGNAPAGGAGDIALVGRPLAGVEATAAPSECDTVGGDRALGLSGALPQIVYAVFVNANATLVPGPDDSIFNK